MSDDTFEYMYNKYIRHGKEEINIMKLPDGTFQAIRPFGVLHWRTKGYRTVTRLRFKKVITGRKQ